MELCKMTFKKITECCCNCIYNKSRNTLLGEGSSWKDFEFIYLRIFVIRGDI
jgi:hypothetical protein